MYLFYVLFKMSFHLINLRQNNASLNQMHTELTFISVMKKVDTCNRIRSTAVLVREWSVSPSSER